MMPYSHEVRKHPPLRSMSSDDLLLLLMKFPIGPRAVEITNILLRRKD